MTTLTNNTQSRLGWIIAALAGALIFAAFVNWGGIPTDNRAGIFWLQMVLFFVLVCAFLGLFWHLLLRPLAPRLRQPEVETLSVTLRQRIALVLAGGNMALFLGAFWDELWHRNYGIPFGEDFFWRPHLLMYFGFGTSVVAGFWALYYLNRRLRGNFQQRFRSNTVIGLLTANALFMLYALASDPFWHWTFGQDLSAWSIPHLILLTSVTLSSLVAVFTHTSTLRPGKWRTVKQITFSDAVPLLLLSAIMMLWLQIMLIDWDQTLMGIDVAGFGLYRPEWLLAANLLAGTTLLGVVSTRVVRMAGGATALGLLALAARLVLIEVFATDLLQHAAWIAALLPLFAIDLWAWYCVAVRDSEPEWRGTAAAVIIAMIPNAFVIRGLYPLEADHLAFALAVVITGVGMSWLSHQVAAAMQRNRVKLSETKQQGAMISPQFSLAVLGAFLLFVVFFVATASPPV